MIKKVEIVNSIIPQEKTFLLPIISASLPKGRRKRADDNIKLLITQLSSIASACRSFPIAGSARLTAEPRNGVRNAANVATKRTDRFKLFSSLLTELLPVRFSINIYSFSFVSIIIVTGPSLMRAISIIAPNSPVAGFFPERSVST